MMLLTLYWDYKLSIQGYASLIHAHLVFDGWQHTERWLQSNEQLEVGVATGLEVRGQCLCGDEAAGMFIAQ